MLVGKEFKRLLFNDRRKELKTGQWKNSCLWKKIH
jgi:hypothetical protein